MKFILAKKLDMSQIFDEKGRIVPVTLIEAGPCQVLDIKTKDKDGYESIQIGFEKLKENKITKSKKKKPFKHQKEFRDDISKYELGQEIKVDIFKQGDLIKVSGISKGKGFSGVVKKWGFGGRPSTHGTKHEERTPGSVGSSYPQRVIKGRKMPGRAGSERITVKNLKIVKIDKENNLLAIKGAIPGRRGILLEIRE
ncbi:MAG TPA: 50S ribosomal protein L3 [bacterium]|nr:50S ribosomal protein L3 [bacterium]